MLPPSLSDFVKPRNQLEIHAYNPEHKLVEYSRSKGIVVEAYAPLGSTDSPMLTDEHVVHIAQKHALNSADILLGYLSMVLAGRALQATQLSSPTVARGLVVLPRSITPSRIVSNLTSAVNAAQKLDAIDMEMLDGLAASGRQKRYFIWRM